MSSFRTTPVTAECLIVCTALFAICQARAFEDIRFRDSQRHWGAAVVLHLVPAHEGPIEPIHRQLQGPFDLWDGEWWRIPINAFHHVNFLHLLMNFSSAWVLGRRLERRWGSLRYLVFLVPAVLIPLLAEFALGNVAMGFSGAICAMLGALMLLQKIEPREFDVPDASIHTVLGLILLMIPATYFDLIQIANVAHLSGLVYGWLAAWVFCGDGSKKRFVRAGFVVAHLFTIPALWLVMYPVNNGRYLWYVAERDSRSNPLEREALLKQAVQADPSLTGVWMRLIQHRLIEGDIPAAWTLSIEGLSCNPSDTDLFEAARRIWQQLPYGSDREAAEGELKRFFGERATVWSKQIRNIKLSSAKSENRPKEQELDPKDFPLDRPLDLHWQPRPREPVIPREFDPERPDSAAEGAVL